MPTGCDVTLNETDIPDQWFIDPYNSGNGCEQSRKNKFNEHCSRKDALLHWGSSPPGNNSQIDRGYS